MWSLDPEHKMWPSGCQAKLQIIPSWAISIPPTSFSTLLTRRFKDYWCSERTSGSGRIVCNSLLRVTKCVCKQAARTLHSRRAEIRLSLRSQKDPRGLGARRQLRPNTTNSVSEHTNTTRHDTVHIRLNPAFLGFYL